MLDTKGDKRTTKYWFLYISCNALEKRTFFVLIWQNNSFLGTFKSFWFTKETGKWGKKIEMWSVSKKTIHFRHPDIEEIMYFMLWSYNFVISVKLCILKGTDKLEVMCGAKPLLTYDIHSLETGMQWLYRNSFLLNWIIHVWTYEMVPLLEIIANKNELIKYK